MLVACVGLFAAGPARADSSCPDADATPDQISVADYAAGITCVVNEQRTEWERPLLEWQRNLAAAAAWHSADMTHLDYFAHTEPDGDTVADRLDRANFIPDDSDRWRAGENLAAGQGAAGTPAAIVSGWMQSREHRLLMLDPGFTMLGVGVTRGWPGPEQGDGGSVTITMDLGWRASSRRG